MNQKELDINEIMMSYPEEAHGPNSAMYSIALEAWRRGIGVRFLTSYVKNSIKVRYALFHGDNEYRFQMSLGDKVSREARKTGKSKELTKQLLSAEGVSVPEGKVISVYDNDYTEVYDYVDSLGYPVIIKPAHASLAIGVRTDIRSREALKSALDYTHGELGYNDIIVERHAEGFDTRTYVAGGQVVGSFKRVPANIVGDDKHSIEKLIEFKNHYRRINPHLSGAIIKIDDEMINIIREQGYELDDVLEKDKKINLNMSTFAKDYSETVDITDEITEDFKMTAVNAVKSIPGMHLAGVDIMMDQRTDRNYVLEVNCRPNIGGHLFPVVGEMRDVPKAIVDYYFPETASVDKGISEYFTFDLDRIVYFLRQGIVKEVVLPPLPKKNVVNRHIILIGDIERHKKQIFKAAIGHRLGGGLKNLKDDEAKLVIAGPVRRIEGFLSALTNMAPKVEFEITDENKWDSLMRYRFEILSGMEAGSSLEKQHESENKTLRKENEKLQKEIRKLKESNSWKVTKPLRALSEMRKNKDDQ